MRRNATHQLLKAGTKNCSASGSEELEPRRGEPMKRFSLMTGSLFCRFHRAPILVQIRTKPKSHFKLRKGKDGRKGTATKPGQKGSLAR